MSIEQVRILIHSDAMTAKLMKKKKNKPTTKKMKERQYFELECS